MICITTSCTNNQSIKKTSPHRLSIEKLNNKKSSIQTNATFEQSLYAIMTLDFYNFYEDLDKKYKTEIEKKKFELTDEFRTNYDELVKLKEYLLNETFSYDVSQYVTIFPYDIESGGIYIALPYTNGYWNYYDADISKNKPKEITNLAGFISNDDYITDYSHFNISKQFRYKLFIPCSEEIGLIATKQLKKLKLIIEFNLAPDGHFIENKINTFGEAIGTNSLIMIRKAKYIIKNDSNEIVTKIIED